MSNDIIEEVGRERPSPDELIGLTPESIAEQRARDGAAFLDERDPGWVERIDLRILDLGECDQCVLGQLFGQEYKGAFPLLSGYKRGTRLLGLSQEEAGELGFEIAFDGVTYTDLTRAWRDLIAHRLGLV
jgi:hypothetical protein